jgi:hypothetical protein
MGEEEKKPSPAGSKKIEGRPRLESSSSSSTFKFSKLRTEFDRERIENLYRRYYFYLNRSSLLTLLGSLSVVAVVFFLLSLIQDRVSTVEESVFALSAIMKTLEALVPVEVPVTQEIVTTSSQKMHITTHLTCYLLVELSNSLSYMLSVCPWRCLCFFHFLLCASSLSLQANSTPALATKQNK